MKTFDSQELERLIKGHCKGELDSVRIHDFVRQTITNTLNHILESGMLEEKDVLGEFLCDLVYRMPPQDGDTVTHTHVDYSARKGHNTLARAVKEFISNMDTNSVDSIHSNKQAN